MDTYKSISDQAKKRGLGNKRVCRMTVFMTIEYEKKFSRLTITCGGMSKSRLADELLKIVLDSPNVVKYLQEKHGGTHEEFWVKPTIIKQNGKQTVIY